jgi:DNA-binding FrmR family transcriptional regulator
MNKEKEKIENESVLNEHEHILADGTAIKHSHTHTQTKAVLNRMSRIIGHMKSIKQMVIDERDCSEVLVQLAAVEAAVKSVSRVIMKDHVEHCIFEAFKKGDNESLEKLKVMITLIFK